MYEESVRGLSITSGQLILILLPGEFVLCVPPSPSHSVLQLERRLVGSWTEESEVMVRWAGYFEQLYQADPTAVELDVRSVTIPIADPPINFDPSLFVETGCSKPVEMGQSSWDLWHPC